MTKILTNFSCLMIYGFISAISFPLFTGIDSLFAETSNPAPFLEIQSTPRQAALGGFQSAHFGHSSDMSANPSSLAFLPAPDLWISHNSSFFESEYSSFGIGSPTKKGGLGFLGQFMNESKIDRTHIDDSDMPVLDAGGFQPYTALMTLGWGSRLKKQMGWGVNLKAWTQKLDKKSYQGLSGDFGGILKNGFLGSDVGLTVRNVGPRYNSKPLPVNLVIGINRELQFKSKKTFNTMVEFSHSSQSESIRCGLEANPSRTFTFRGGYVVPLTSNVSQYERVSLGFGLKLQDWMLDYAWVPLTDLGESHIFSFSIKLGLSEEEKLASAQAMDLAITARMEKKSEFFLEKGNEAIEHKDWETAIAELTQSITWNPDNKKPQELLDVARKEKNKKISNEQYQEAIDLLRDRQWMDASLKLKEASKLDPKNPQIVEAMIIADRQLRRRDLGASNESATLWFNKGVDLYVNGEFDLAIKEWQKVTAKYPDWPYVQEYLAKAKAMSLEQRVNNQYSSQKNSMNIELLSRKAYAFYSLGNIDDAISHWKKILIIDSSNQDAAWAITEATRRKELLNGKGREPNKKEVQELNMKAFNEYSSGKLKNAIGFWSEALQLDPLNPTLKANIQRAQIELSLTEGDRR